MDREIPTLWWDGGLDFKIPTSRKGREKWGTRFYFVVRETSQGFQGYQVALVGYGYRRREEGLLVDCFLQNGEGLGEDLVLVVELLKRRGWGMGRGHR